MKDEAKRVSRSWRAYTALAVLALNTLIILVLLNVVTWATLRVLAERERHRLPSTLTELASRFGPGWVSSMYPGWDQSNLLRLWNEWIGLTFDYEAFTQFRVRPTQGLYINVSEHGFRSNGTTAPWPPDPAALNVFVFGGSTTFGTMLPDGWTLPAALQRHVRTSKCHASAQVYNFARPAYISTQENALLERLLLSKAVPNVAIFVDGLNDSVWRRGEPRYTDQLTYLVRTIHARGTWWLLGTRARDFLISLPMIDAANLVLARFGSARPTMPVFPASRTETENHLNQWIATKGMREAVAHQFGTSVLTVWQPSPTYQYDLSYHAFGQHLIAWGGSAQSVRDLSHALYAQMEERRHDSEVRGNFLWLGDIQRAKRENLYVDSLHYTAAFTDEIAKAIFDDMRRRGWLACRTGAVDR